MYNNKPQHRFNKKSKQFINDEKFLLASKQPQLKTVTSKDRQIRDLCEFWVLDNCEEVQCVVWNDLAQKLIAEFNLENFTAITITYKNNFNDFTGKTRYSVRDFAFTN